MSIHIEAAQGDIAKTVLLPGDPMRAKWIAETFLEDVICYNEIRGMLGFTGTYKGQAVSVQGGGMGIPSTLIYSHELINEYGVENLVRVGTAGSYQSEIKLGDIVIAMAASTTSAINSRIFSNDNYSPTASYKLFEKAMQFASKNDIEIKAGNVLSSDEFYEESFETYKKWARYGVLCVEMETSGLYTIAAKYNVNALSILSISDSLVTRERADQDRIVESLHAVTRIALGTLEK